MTQDRPVTSQQIMLAAITGAHGVRGEVRLKLFGDGLQSLKAHKSFNDGALSLVGIRSDNKGGAIARFAEVTDRNAAEALRGTALKVPRAALPPLDEGEYYHADLVGLRAISDAGEYLGVVSSVENYGAGDLLEIERPAADDGPATAGKATTRFLVPFTTVAVPEWDNEKVIVTAAFAHV